MGRAPGLQLENLCLTSVWSWVSFLRLAFFNSQTWETVIATLQGCYEDEMG